MLESVEGAKQKDITSVRLELLSSGLICNGKYAFCYNTQLFSPKAESAIS